MEPNAEQESSAALFVRSCKYIIGQDLELWTGYKAPLPIQSRSGHVELSGENSFRYFIAAAGALGLWRFCNTIEEEYRYLRKNLSRHTNAYSGHIAAARTNTVFSEQRRLWNGIFYR